MRQAVRHMLGVSESRLSMHVRNEKCNMVTRECLLKVLCNMGWYSLNIGVTSQNSRHWFSKNPHPAHGIPLLHLKVRVLCAASTDRIIESLFFKDRLIFNHCVQLILTPLLR